MICQHKVPPFQPLIPKDLLHLLNSRENKLVCDGTTVPYEDLVFFGGKGSNFSSSEMNKLLQSL